MKIHEYQAKEIFRRYGVPTPAGRACLSLQEADDAIADIDGGVVGGESANSRGGTRQRRRC